jgi:hypothetical protein
MTINERRYRRYDKWVDYLEEQFWSDELPSRKFYRKYANRNDEVDYVQQDYSFIDCMSEAERKKAIENFDKIMSEDWR